MIEQLNLHGGSFKAVFPYRWYGWLGWVIMALLFLFGVFLLADGFANSVDDSLIGGSFVCAVGLMGLGFLTPASHEKDLYNIRQQAIDPAVLEAQAKESGLTVESWFLRQTTYVPTSDPNDWILPAPGPASWNKENRYLADEGEEPLPEHPHKVGTPIPATLSLYGVFGTLAALFAVAGSWGAFSASTSGDEPVIFIAILIVICLILAVFGWLNAKMLTQMIDTPTSLVRSAPLGHHELVGQVRPSHEGVLRVVVDGNERMYMENMVAYNWTYEQKQERTVQTKEGTRKETRWVTIRSDSGAVHLSYTMVQEE